MRKISVLLFGLLVAFGVTAAVVSAEGEVASIGTDTYATLADAVEAANAMDGGEDGVTITLLQNTTFNSNMTISKNITIEGAFTLTRGDAYTGTLFTVDADASLTLNDLTIDGNNNWTLDYDKIAATGKISLKTDYVAEAGAPVATAAMFVVNGSVTVNNTTIQNNTGREAFSTVSGSSVTLNDGATVTHCASPNQVRGAAFYAAGGEIVINDGVVISDNLATGNGVVARLLGDSVLTMNGGEIINNYTTTFGIIHGDSSTGSTFIMNDGVIKNNYSSMIMVYLQNNSGMIMNGGEISNNFFEKITSFGVIHSANPPCLATIYDGVIINNYTYDNQPYWSITANYKANDPTCGQADLYGGVYSLYECGVRGLTLDDLCAPGYTAYPIDENDDGEADVYKVIKMITVEFEDVSDPHAEIERLYNINLITTDTNLLNKLKYIDLTFTFEETGKWIGYEINATNENVDVHMADNITPRYRFEFDDLATDLAETDKITIGQAKFTGYGEFSFGLDTSAETNKADLFDDVEDDLVMTYIPEVVAGGGYIGFGDSVHEIVPMPKRNLTINIMFPNDIEYKTAEYQKMTVKIAGGTVNKEISLGNENFDETADDSIENPATVTLVDTNTDDGYRIAIDLPYETTYTVIVEGAGYRTARYSVNLTENKTLNFWNNVKQEATEVEVGEASVKVKENFLAGDIIKDDNINIYDISAVLSYFGTKNISETNHPDYIKYDLNRDGVIDAKDVSFILVSWDN